MGIISVEQAGHLYWLGRYTERVYTTLRIYSRSFDEMIDESRDSYQSFCRSVDIPDIYVSKEDFLRRYPFDPTVPDSIVSNLERAYDNAVVLRETIGSEALSYVQLAVYDIKLAAESDAPMIELQQVLDHILAFWGIVDDQIDSEETRNMINLYARLGMPREELVREVHRMVPRVKRSGMAYDAEKLEMIRERVEEPELDHYSLVADVETLVAV